MNLKQTLAACLICLVHSAYAQYTFEGLLTSKMEKSPVDFGCVCLLKDGTVIQSYTTEKDGKFCFSQLADGSYHIHITTFGYEDVQDSIVLSANCTRNYELVEKAIKLDEVLVEGDRSEVVKRTANGQVFFLSKDAKKMRNPFEALQEIPLLISDPNTSSVKLHNGTSPLILIDGFRVNSGIAPLDPSEIESVEVINVTSARYLQEGIRSIINVTLKRKPKPYLWVQAATRHEVPIRKGMGVGYFEVGNAKYSLYGRLSYNYTHHDDTESTIERSSSTYHQTYSSVSRNNGYDWLGDLTFKAKLNPKDYLAVHAYFKTTSGKMSKSGNGTYDNGRAINYVLGQSSRDKSGIFTSTLYFKHNFQKKEDLEIRMAYNYNENTNDAFRSDSYGTDLYETNVLFQNQRNSGNLNIDYDKVFDNGNSLSIGNRTNFRYDKIHPTNIHVPLFKHHQLSEYLYGSYSGQIKKIYYMASLGVEGIWLKAGDTDNNYFRPKASASATWSPNDNNSVQLGYSFSNTTPSVGNLNPYNTSTDSLLIVKGNPFLTPQMDHNWNLSYSFNVGKLYLTPSINYQYVNDLIEACGYIENGIYTSTYENSSHYSNLSAGVYGNYNFKKGNIYGGGGWAAGYFEGQSGKHIFYVSGGFSFRANKSFSFYGDIDYCPKDFSVISQSRYYHPTSANVQVNYNITPNFYVALCLQHFTGEYREKTMVNNGEYHSVSDARYKDKNLRPWILIRYTIRKNPKNKIKLGNILDSTEKGISIK